MKGARRSLRLPSGKGGLQSRPHSLSRPRLVGTWQVQYHDPVTGQRRCGGSYRNVICTTGCGYLAGLLNLEGLPMTTSTLWGAVGTGTTPPQSSDTRLQTEIARVALATTSRNGAVVTQDFFFNTATGNGTLTEAGLFLGASGAANSGALLSHCAIAETKTSIITMTLEFSITIG